MVICNHKKVYERLTQKNVYFNGVYDTSVPWSQASSNAYADRLGLANNGQNIIMNGPVACANWGGIGAHYYSFQLDVTNYSTITVNARFSPTSENLYENDERFSLVGLSKSPDTSPSIQNKKLSYAFKTHTFDVSSYTGTIYLIFRANTYSSDVYYRHHIENIICNSIILT